MRYEASRKPLPPTKLKKPTANWQFNIIPIKTLEIKKLKKNLKRQLKPTKCLLTIKNAASMTNTVLTALKIWAAVLTRPHSKALKISSAEEAGFPTCLKACSEAAALGDSAASVHPAAAHREAAARHGEQTFDTTYKSILPMPYTARR